MKLEHFSLNMYRPPVSTDLIILIILKHKYLIYFPSQQIFSIVCTFAIFRAGECSKTRTKEL